MINSLKRAKVLVTGADGFIGSHLVEMLVKAGIKVKALAYYNSFNHWGWLEDVRCIDDIEVITGDIRDAFYCKKITKGMDVIFNLASLIAIPYSYRAPESYVSTNIIGTLNICQAALENNCKTLIHTSTSEVYGTAKYIPMDEKHPLQAQSPYSATKIGADAIATSFNNSYGLPLIIARPFNTYGPRQSARAIIPSIITQIGSGKKKISLGDISPMRDFNYVEDTCSGLIGLALCEKAVGQVVNIGSNTEVSIKGLFSVIRDLMDSDAKIVVDDSRLRPSKSEVYRLRCDNSLIKKLTGFKPKYTLEKGVEKTVEWFTDPRNLSKYKFNIYNI